MTITHFADFDLDEKLLKALAQKGFEQPTLIQSQTLLPTLEGRNIIGSSPTGTGKTVAFLLPVIQYLLDFPRRKPGPPRVLILTPTRELTTQVATQAKTICDFTALKIATITGGTSYVNHIEVLSETQDIVIATPGRLLQYTKERAFDYQGVEILILDEADRMLDMGFFNDIEQIVKQTNNRKQTLLFSATMEGELLQKFIKKYLTDPLTIEAEPSRKENKKILQYYYRADTLEHKIALLIDQLKTLSQEKGIVFIRKKERLHEIVALLHQAKLSCAYLEGDMIQTRRNQAINAIAEGKQTLLLATDIAARGLDIQDIGYVINFDLPRTADVYLHRIGRTGRNGRKGIAISLVEAHDYPLLEKIRRYINEPIRQRVIESLRPVTKAPTTVKKNKTKTKKKKDDKKSKDKNIKQQNKPKKRARVEKNKGKRKVTAKDPNNLIIPS